MGARALLAVSVLLIGGYFLLVASNDTSPSEDARLNVVVILIDTLRPDYLGIYGHEPETAPFLSHIAERSTVFTRAFSTSSWTAPSTASLFTSVYPTQHGVLLGFQAHEEQMRAFEAARDATIEVNRIADTLTTLPEFFKDHGYATFGMASNRNIGEEEGFTRGFDRFFEAYNLPVEYIVDKLKEWKKDLRASRPYFLYVHLNDVHVPYLEREPYYRRLAVHASGDRRRYLSEIGYVDAHIKKIYKELRLDRNTLLVVLSDHGEEFNDHGRTEHRTQLYRELNQVLMLVHSPGLDIAAQRIESNVSLIDVFPTLIELCGLPSLSGMTGVSLAPLVRNGPGRDELYERLARRTLFAHRVHNVDPSRQYWAATRGYWKLYEPWNNEAELYDHRVDFAEMRNVIEQHNDVADILMEQLEAFKNTPGDASVATVEVLLDDELLETLLSLGYVE